MPDASTTLTALKDVVRTFCEARDWEQFHGPHDLAIAVITEAAELLDHLHFKNDADLGGLSDASGSPPRGR